MGPDGGGVGLLYIGKLLCTVLGAGAGAESPSGGACGSSRRGELRGRVGLSRSLQRCVAGDPNRPAERGVVAAS